LYAECIGIIIDIDIVREKENDLMIEFHKVIEEIKLLNLEDKIYLKDLLDRMLIEEKRKQIKKNAEESLREYKEGRIKFGTIEDLRKEAYED
jgi:hypothetical protein